MEGWIKLHRELLTKPIWIKSTSQQKAILITILSLANHKKTEWEWQGIKFSVNEGQFITSLETLRKHSGKDVTIQNVRSALLKFEKFGFLTNESTKTGRLITVANWALYQGSDNVSNKATNKEVTKNQQRGNKEVTSTKNDKNNKNENNDKSVKEHTIFSNSIQKDFTKKIPLNDKNNNNNESQGGSDFSDEIKISERIKNEMRTYYQNNLDIFQEVERKTRLTAGRKRNEKIKAMMEKFANNYNINQRWDLNEPSQTKHSRFLTWIANEKN